MNDMQKVTEPKSDQWNFDDFQAGPLTFTIEAVRVKSGQEQPVEMTLAGTPKFYRPCKSMCRCLVAAWGADSSKYVGRSLTLYGDPTVKWGGMEVGGIRISHMSHIDSAMTMALTVTRANKKPFTVKPLAVAASIEPEDAPPTITADQAAELEHLCKTGGADLTAGFMEAAGVDSFAKVPAKLYRGCKKWIADERGKEMRAAHTTDIDTQP